MRDGNRASNTEELPVRLRPLQQVAAMRARLREWFGGVTHGLPARRAALPFVLIGLLLVVRALLTPAAPEASSAHPGASAALVNASAPNVTLVDPSGNRVSLDSLRGKVMVLNFWYVACPGCRAELQALQHQYDASKAAGFVVVGVDVADDAHTTADFARQNGVTYPVFLDDRGRAFAAYQIAATPTSFVIDRSGVIRDKFVGPVDQTRLAKDVATLLSHQ